MYSNYLGTEIETEISIIDLCKSILKKWKAIVAATLALALVLGLFGFYSYQKSKNATVSTEVDYDSLDLALTDEEKTDVEDAAKVITSYRSMYNKQKEYNDNSIYQSLNPYAIKTLELSYYVDNDYVVSYPIISEQNDMVPIVQTYASVLSKESLYEEMSSAIDSSIKPTYYQEVVIADTEQQEFGVLKVTIYADSDEMLKSIGEFVKQSLENEAANITEIYGSHELVLTSEVEKTVVDTKVATDQQANMQRLTDMTKAISDQESVFSGDQLTYLKALVHESLAEEVSIVKYVVIGALIGLICSLGYFALKYLMSNTVKTDDELESLYGIKSFAGSFNLIATKVNLIKEKENFKNIALILNSEVKDFDASELSKALGDDVEVVKELLKDTKAIETISKKDAVIFVERLKVSNLKTIDEEFALCKIYGAKVIGTINIE